MRQRRGIANALIGSPEALVSSGPLGGKRERRSPDGGRLYASPGIFDGLPAVGLWRIARGDVG